MLQTEQIKYVNTIKEGFDYDNYRYAVCECTFLGEGIKVPKNILSFTCPRCGKALGFASCESEAINETRRYA